MSGYSWITNSVILNNIFVLKISDDFGKSLESLSFTVSNHAPTLIVVGGLGTGKCVSTNLLGFWLAYVFAGFIQIHDVLFHLAAICFTALSPNSSIRCGIIVIKECAPTCSLLATKSLSVAGSAALADRSLSVVGHMVVVSSHPTSSRPWSLEDKFEVATIMLSSSSLPYPCARKLSNVGNIKACVCVKYGCVWNQYNISEQYSINPDCL